MPFMDLQKLAMVHFRKAAILVTEDKLFYIFQI